MSQFRDAEAFLAELGIERDPLNVPLKEPDPPAEALAPADPAPLVPPAGAHEPAVPLAPAGDDAAAYGPAPSAREAGRLASEPPVVPPGGPDPIEAGTATTPTAPLPLEDEVAKAMSYIRNSVSATPATEKKLRDRLARRDTPAAAIEAAIVQARRERLVDDAAMAKALCEEWLERGHAPFRIKQDLRKRGIPDAIAQDLLGRYDEEDPESRAFEVAFEVATRYRRLEPEAQFRRLVGYLSRRGHAPGTARKVAREVVFSDREDERTATR